MDPIVIVGSGLAGYNVARELRKLDAATALTIITADDGRFYSKPMLSNALTKGQTPDELAITAAAQMAEQLDARILTHSRVTAIEPATHTVETAEEHISYGRLVLALGAEPIRLALGGDAAGAAMSVNDLADYARFRAAIATARSVVIMGAGLIGCEFANDLCNAGLKVTVIDPSVAPLGGFVPEAAGRALQAALTDRGVTWHFGTTVANVERANSVYRLTLASGENIEADAVLSAVGLRPRTDLAQAAGLTVNRGIVTDRNLRTSSADIYALGDCAEVEGLVLAFVMPLMNAARALGKTLAGTQTPVRYPVMPIVVKTPAHPIVVTPPPAALAGTWAIDHADRDVRGLFRDEQGALRGFVLTGDLVAEKAALSKQVPPLLP